MTARPALLLVVLIGLSFNSFAQNIGQKDWYRADTSIITKSNLQDLRKEILSWKEYYSSAKNDAMVARCFYYLQQIADRTTEDSLYFKNSLYIDSILKSEGSSPLMKTIMHLMKARRISRFTQNVRFAGNKRHISSYDPGISYSEMSHDQMDSLVQVQFEKALAMSSVLPPTDTKELRWLCTDTDIFIFTPDIQDIIHAERIAAFSHALYGPRDNDVMPLLALSQDEFLRLEVLEKDSTQENINRVFAFYKQWIQHHAANPAVYYYLESLARHEIFGDSKFTEEGSKLYEQYLHRIGNSPYDMVKAHAVYLLCDMWNRQAEQYNPIANSSIEENRGRYEFRPEFKMHYVKSRQLYETNRQLLRQFPVLDEMLSNMKEATEMPSLYLNMYGTQVPGLPVLSMLRFRNVEKVYFKIVRRDAEERIPFNMPVSPGPYISKAAVQERVVDLPKTDDYQWHNIFLKIDPLPPGRYLMIFSDSAIAEENRHLGHIEVAVTQIAVINTDKRVFVLDRQTGLPLNGASVLTGKLRGKDGDRVDTTWNSSLIKTVNDSGFVTINNLTDAVVKVSYQGDVYRGSIYEHESDLEYDLYDEEYYDNLQEFLREKAGVQIFTDRGLYRPGQTVHYKAIVFTSHPKTLERIVWSGKKLKSPFFRKLFRRGSPKLTVYLRDAMDRPLDSTTIVPDEYGAISGSFVIPKDGITGAWLINCKDLQFEVNGGSFHVEEYKRPTFEVLLEKPNKEFDLGDSIPVNIIVQSFAGARLTNTRIKYSVTVYGYMPYTGPEDLRRSEVLLSGIAYTDDKGELQLQIVDTALAGIEVADSLEYSLHYTVEVQAVDATGESDEGYLSIVKSNRPVYINATVPAIIDRYSPDTIEINTVSENIGIVKKQLQVRFIKIPAYRYDHETDIWPTVDLSLYAKDELEKWFPQLKPLPGQDTTESLVYETVFTTGGGKFTLPINKLPAGHYKMELVCRENGKILGETEREFSVFDIKANALPIPVKRFDHLPNTNVRSGEKITWTTANADNDVYAIYHIAWLAKTRAGISERSDYIMKPERKGLNQWVYTIPQEAVGKLLLTHLYISRNVLYQQEYELEVEEIQPAPEIIVEQFRSRLAPGAKETFTVSIKTKNQRTLAQLMTTLYDAALDRLSRHAWYVHHPQLDLQLTNEWPVRIAERVEDDIDFFPLSKEGGVFSFLDLDPLHYNISIEAGNRTYANNLSTNLTFGFSTTMGITNEVVVVGYGSAKKNSTESTLAPELPKLPAPLTRKNFSETAFFYPRIYAGKDGFYTIKFTLPESVTTWKWKMMAHTQDGKFAYTERTLVSQLPLMVQPDMPRFLYQGDKIVLKSRISNLDSNDMSGTLECAIEDAITGEDLTGRLLATNKKEFSVGRSSNSTGAFEIAIPTDLLHPLRIKISAQAGSVSDGEEHIIPIQAKKILVSKHIALNNQKTVAKPSLPADANPYGIGMYIKAQPKAGMVNALPWLAGFPHGCAEQTFNKIFAHALAVKMVRTDTGFHAPLTARKSLPVSQTMPEGIPEASMPWLNLHNHTSKQQQQLAKILDTVASKVLIAKHFGSLAGMQKENGGLSWFEGGNSNYYISSYILAGLGKLRIVLNDMFEGIRKDYQFFMPRLIRYSDEQFMERNISQSNHELLQYLYGRSYFADLYPLQPAAISRMDSLLKKGWDVAPMMSIGRQALLVTVTLRFLPVTNDLHQKALKHLESLRQLAIRDNVNGIRWKAISDDDDLDIRSEEWVVKIAEAFEEDAGDQVTVPGIMQWLLQARQEHNWTTTKATADVLGLLFRQQQSLTGGAQQWAASINNKTYGVSNDLVKGELFRFIGLREFPAEIPVSAGYNGGINYYYFTENPELDSAANGIKIARTLMRYNNKSSAWELVSPSTVLSTGDKIRATLTITTPRMLQYVYIDEKRAASCEPTDATSGYEFATDFVYYKSVRDVGYQFYAEKIPSGKSTISYEMVVAKTGSFAWGPAALECMYRPEIKAYSNSLSLEIKE